jgi:predicted nuclease with TOPRIM domain
MYFANLSFLLLNKYLQDALHVGFLRSEGDLFFMTKKGEAFLERYNRFSNRYSTVKEDLAQLEDEAQALEKMCKRRRNSKCVRRKGFATIS